MREIESATSSGLTARRWSGLILILLASSLPFVGLHHVSRLVVLDQIRHQAMGVAIAVASAVDVSQVQQVHTAADESGDAYRQLLGLLTRIRDLNPDLRFLYIMRRSSMPLSSKAQMEFVVDATPRDFNRNGVIDSSERSETPGTPYSAAGLPALLAAWDKPEADPDITPDPPYPDLISGYAPIRDDGGRAVAIVGADILAQTVARKMLGIRVVMTLVWLIICLLISLVVHLYYQQRDAFERNRALNRELEQRNEMLRQANDSMARHAEQFERDLKLAQTVQEGFLPSRFPQNDRVIFDKYYLTCATLGGDLFDVFDVDDDNVGLVMADVAGHGVSAALISGLLKMAISSVRNQADGEGSLCADMTKPGHVVRMLNELLVKEMPVGEFITLIYAVLNLTENRMTFANAGHPWPIRYVRERHLHETCRGKSGLALGLEEGQEYPENAVAVEEGDKVIFFTDGVTEAMNAAGEEFGDERLVRIVDEKGGQSPHELITAVREAVEVHRGGQAVNDDFSMLVAEVR